MTDLEKIPVGRYLVIGSGRDWRVMEQFGAFRMLKKVFVTQAATVKRAQVLAESDAS
jgi:hypothetical protein